MRLACKACAVLPSEAGSGVEARQEPPQCMLNEAVNERNAKASICVQLAI